jgi:hypothetical protein
MEPNPRGTGNIWLIPLLMRYQPVSFSKLAPTPDLSRFGLANPG